MRFRRRDRCTRTRQQRLIAGVAICAYLLTTIGFPLPAYVNKGGMPFPCQNHACGCATADQCWDHCCCFSTTEKLAWAREHNIVSPERLVADAEVIEAHAGHSSAKPSACGAAKSCCTEHHGSATTSAGRHAHEPHEYANCGKDHDDNASLGVTFVVGIKARQCRGLTDFWCHSGAVVSPPSVVRWQFPWNVVERLAEPETRLSAGILSPPVPPPEV
jgi:hypothetical protein